MALALMPWCGREAIAGINKAEGQRFRYAGEASHVVLQSFTSALLLGMRL
jgi:hypothetical protein